MRPKVPLSLQKAYAEHFPSSIIKRSHRYEYFVN